MHTRARTCALTNNANLPLKPGFFSYFRVERIKAHFSIIIIIIIIALPVATEEPAIDMRGAHSSCNYIPGSHMPSLRASDCCTLGTLR
jgi:hypothetical protein